MKKTLVLSLGGSLIVPEKVDPKWLEDFKRLIITFRRKYKFVVECGGGFVAREYITILKEEHKSKKQQSLAGIDVTRMNAKIMMQLFGNYSNKELPKSMNQIKNLLEKKDIVFCGALRYAPNQTSDSTAAKIASYFKTEFVNLTNFDGLYTKNPSKNKDARFISSISWKDFEKIALKSKYSPGQHFVLDQNASKIIKKHKIKTYILGKSIENIKKFLNRKKFIGTVIGG